MGVLIENITTVLEHFGIELQLQKHVTKKRINQLEIALATAFEDFNTTCRNKFQDVKVKVNLMLLN